MPVIILIGISLIPIVLVIVSTRSIKMPPSNIEIGIALRFDDPTSILEKCGIIKPTQPIVPATHTEQAVNKVEHIIAIVLINLTFAPSVCASSIPKDSTSIQYDIKNKMIIEGIKTININLKSLSDTYEKLPIVQ